METRADHECVLSQTSCRSNPGRKDKRRRAIDPTRQKNPEPLSQSGKRKPEGDRPYLPQNQEQAQINHKDAKDFYRNLVSFKNRLCAFVVPIYLIEYKSSNYD